MNILITAGGTTEPIDHVRSITNTSTGMLGSLIAKAFDQLSDTDKIYYICGKNSVVPQSTKAEILFIDTVASLEDTIRKVLNEGSIDIIIHSMAVSDYRVKSVTTQSLLEDSIQDSLAKLSAGNKQLNETSISSLFDNVETLLPAEGKISSKIDNLVLFMEQTPKIISLFQTLAPQATLVGFKLLDHVTEDTLIDTAYHLLQNNNCSFVLANDLRDITKEQHIGFLIDAKKNYKRYTAKAEIADAIAAVTTHIRRKIG